MMNKYLLILSIALVIVLIIIAIIFLPSGQYEGSGEGIGTSTTPYYTSTVESTGAGPETPYYTSPVTRLTTISTFTSLTSTSSTSTYTTTLPPVSTTIGETTTTEVPQYPWGPVSVSGEWRLIGPDGGDMHFVYVTRNHILFASHGFGGVWRSTDGGEWWDLVVNEGFIELAFHSMTEYDNGTLVAGSNRGLWVSRDNGVSWDKIVTGSSMIDDSGKYDIYSVAITRSGDIAFTASINRGNWGESGLVVYNGFFIVGNGLLQYYEIPVNRPPPWTITHIGYDPCFNGSEAYFVSSSTSGLWVYWVDSGVWEKILDRNTTKVYVDTVNDRVYVGTIGDWFYVGWIEDSGWVWEQITIPGLECGVAATILPDPYDSNRLWLGGASGTRGTLYKVPLGVSGDSFVAVGWYINGEWRGLKIKGNWGVSIAVDRHGPGEDPGEYMIDTPFGRGARIAYVAQAGKGNIQKTVDGGATWFPSYDGIYADTVNKVNHIGSGLWAGGLAITCVSGTQLSMDLGETWVEGLDFTIGDIGYGLPGYQWAVVSLETPLEGRYDLLVATGYPPEQMGGNGVYAVDTSCLIDGGNQCFKLLVPGPAHDLVVNDSILYIGRMDSGVLAYDLLSGSSWYLEGMPSDEAGINLLLVGNTLFVATEKGGNRDSDNYFFADQRSTGGLYACRDDVCTPIYTGERVVAFSIYGSTALILTNNHKLILIENIGDPEPITILLPTATYSDMVVDWDHGVIYLSTFDREIPGIYYASLIDVFIEHSIELHPLVNGIMTYSIRDLELVGNVLFAGSQGYGVWKIELNISG